MIVPQGQDFTNLYLPFNSLSQEELDKLDQMIAIDAVKDRTKVYSCNCGYVYVIGDCGKAMVIARCPKCNRNIGGQNHNNINQAIDYKSTITQTGYNSSFITHEHSAPRSLKPVVFRIGNLILSLIIYLCPFTSPQLKTAISSQVSNTWGVLKKLLKVNDGKILFILYSCLKQYANIMKGNLTQENSRNKMEEQFTLAAMQIIDTYEEQFNRQNVQEEKKSEQQFLQQIFRESQSFGPFVNTLQICPIVNYNETTENIRNMSFTTKKSLLIASILNNLKEMKLISHLFPLIRFMNLMQLEFSGMLTRSYCSENTLSILLQKARHLDDYYKKYVVHSWNEVCENFQTISVQCKQNQLLQKIDISGEIPIDYFVVEDQDTKSQQGLHHGHQLKYMIDTLKAVQNQILINNECKSHVELKKIKKNNIIHMREDLSIKQLILFEFYHLLPGQKKQEIDLQAISNYFLDENNNYCIISDFGAENYFKYKEDIKLFEKMYPPSLCKNILTSVKQEDESYFLKFCSTQDNQLEMREKLIYIHKYLTQLEKEDQKSMKESPLLSVLNELEYGSEEPYFKKALDKFKVSQTVALLEILETVLMDYLVEDIPQQCRENIIDSEFKKLNEEFKKKSSNSNGEKDCQKELLLTIGRYIIRGRNNLRDKKYWELDAFEMITYYEEDHIFDRLKDKENNPLFDGMTIPHKNIYQYYQKLRQSQKEITELQEKHKKDAKIAETKNLQNNVQMFGQELGREQIQHGYKIFAEDNEGDQQI